ncbi:PadR family transcriptional regulator [Mobilicoccus pelagius]|uniref:Putative transcriptional regulator n=1 Tax=Mobilicoccus pelagius NBRC 104925 TaxID=1089455 RepID=H5UMU6_9MICO|nr:PadR family transcriptional regulator [Mobilicoccus pelagius]GAB47054.1 putative transcriptional regulator [Mobilicoccus pelagius NBRC 104925]
MSVFGHGQMRLYLLALLREGPRHGYDVIRDLEHRFSGLYSPSAGTVYPRLAKLEEEGLIERTDEGRKALYRLTDTGRAEVESRGEEVDALESSLDASATRLAEEMRARVRAGAADLRAEMGQAADAATSTLREDEERPAWWQAAMESGLGNVARSGAPGGLGLEMLLGGLTRGLSPDVETVTRLLNTWGPGGFSTPENTDVTNDTSGRRNAAPASGDTARDAGPTSPSAATSSATRSPGPDAAGSAASAPLATPTEAPVEVVGEVVDNTVPASDSPGDGDDRRQDPSFPTAEQVREVVAILKDAGDRIREVLDRPRG